MSINHAKKQRLVRAGKYTIKEVLDHVQFVSKREGRNTRVDFDGDLINMASQRYQLFAKKGCRCVICGLEGSYFIKERHASNATFHFNLYGVDENGDEVVFTKDHIVPKCNGGSNTIDNYQVMCYVCNHQKGLVDQAWASMVKMLKREISNWERTLSDVSPEIRTMINHEPKIEAAKRLCIELTGARDENGNEGNCNCCGGKKPSSASKCRQA